MRWAALILARLNVQDLEPGLLHQPAHLIYRPVIGRDNCMVEHFAGLAIEKANKQVTLWSENTTKLRQSGGSSAGAR